MRSLIFIAFALSPAFAAAAEIRVQPGDDVQDALDQAMPGDVVILEQGSHAGPVQTSRDGRADAPITLRGMDSATLTAGERVLDVRHAYFHIEDLTVDAQFAEDRVLRVNVEGIGFAMRRTVVRNARRHCIDIRSTSDVLIEDSVIHHCLNWDGARADAHGISAEAVQGLTIRNTEVHTFTGDAFQIDPSRTSPGWDDVLIEGCTFWLAPITDGSGGVPAGVVPGENAIDTKTVEDEPGHLTVRDTTAYGFRNGEISNMAAFNIKENVVAVFERVTVYDSEIAFRLRGAGGVPNGARPSLGNVLIYDVDKALRLEDELRATIDVHHVTFGADIDQHVQLAGGAEASTLDAQNIAVFGDVPSELAGPTTVSATVQDFEDSNAHNYIPVASAAWLDSGVQLGFTLDRRGATRPQGDGPDPGAYEFGESSEPGDDEMDDIGSVNAEPGPDMDAISRPDGGSAPDSGGAGSGAEDGGCSCSTNSRPKSLYGLLTLLLAGALAIRRTT